MSQYRAKSQLYQVFVTCRSFVVNCDEIYIPKLNITLEYDNKLNLYVKQTWGKSIDNIQRNIKATKEKGWKPIWRELNHVLIENSLIDLINSEDILNRQLASEILIQKFDNIKING